MMLNLARQKHCGNAVFRHCGNALFSIQTRFCASNRQPWEYTPSRLHRSLVLTLYRNLLKELVTLQTVRRKTLIFLCRTNFRKRAAATEKLLIDECIEEARRAIYTANKMNRLVTEKSYEYDSMFIPKDTGQNVKEYMEEVYDPAVSKRSAAAMTREVVGGREDEHQRMTPLAKAKKSRDVAGAYKDDSFSGVFRPPAPPGTEGI